MDRSATYDFPLVIIVTMDLSRTVSEIKIDSCKIFPPPAFNAPVVEGSLCNALELRKLD